ncbi:MAG: peptide deformylase [Spirochaetes bacterium]|nr:peptide deformylase [Spirochaetota bacterium]
MAVRNIYWYGADVLKNPCAEVTRINDGIQTLIEDMFETMRAADGVGLAANQVGVSKRIIVIGMPGGEKRKALKIAMINPKILTRSETLATEEEGCLSVPGVRTEVIRPDIVSVRFLDIDGNEHTIEADDMLARIVQHETDHLDGILFVERIPTEVKKTLTLELKRIKREGRTRIL